MDAVAYGFHHPYDLFDSLSFSPDAGDGTVSAGKNATAGHRDKGLVRAVETGFQQVPGDTLPFKEQIGVPITTVHDLDGTCGTYRKFDPVIVPAEKNRSAPSGTGTCRGAGYVLFSRFTG
jgi:hypothetical protein